MFHKIKPARAMGCFILLGSAVLAAQAPKAQDSRGAAASSVAGTGTNAADACIGCELPILLRQTVEAGKAPVGAKVEAQSGYAHDDWPGSTSATRGSFGRGYRVSGKVRRFALAAGDSHGLGTMEEWRGETQDVFDRVVLSADADGSSQPLLCAAGGQTELGRSRYHRSTEPGSEVVESEHERVRGSASNVHLQGPGSHEECEVGEQRRRLRRSCFAFKHQTEQGDDLCPRN